MSSAPNDSSSGPQSSQLPPGQALAAGSQPLPGEGSFFRDKLWFWLPIAPLVAADLWSKAWAFGFLHEKFQASAPIGSEPKSVQYWEEGLRWTALGSREPGFLFELVAWRNTGTLWGLGRDFNAGLIVIRVLALALLIWFASRTTSRARIQLLVLGSIMAGAIGNLYDNLTQVNRGVRDFIYLSYKAADGAYPLRGWNLNPFPAFNVADACISVGATVLVLLLLFQKDPTKD